MQEWRRIDYADDRPPRARGTRWAAHQTWLIHSPMPDAPTPPDPTPRLRLRILFGDAMLGPGKADLLEQIRDTGSIAAAGRAMGMSYKRAWSLVEEMNAAFRVPLVDRTRGGAAGGGARLSATGAEVLARYRRIEALAAGAAEEEIAALRALLADISRGK